MRWRPDLGIIGKLLEKLGIAVDEFRTWVGPVGEDYRALDSEFERKARSKRGKLLGVLYLVAVLGWLGFWLAFGANEP